MTDNYDIRAYYNKRAKYQLLPYTESWDEVISKFMVVIQNRLSRHFGPGRRLRVLDCTCGVGTQAIAFARLGHNVYASDISDEMLRYTTKYSEERGYNIPVFRQDLRLPFPKEYMNFFDVVVSLNNSLVFISNEDDGEKQLIDAFKNINSLLSDRGIFMASLRPYDEYFETLPTAPPNRIYEYKQVDDIQVKFYQEYEWLPDNKHYICKTFYDFKDADDNIITVTESMLIRAWREDELTSALNAARLNVATIETVEDNKGHYKEKWIIAKP